LISEEMKQILELFDQGRELYKLKKFEEAQGFFKKVLKIKPDDGPAKVYLDRCEHYKENPPPADWDGVFIMKTK
jgi:tetratricopeptide (TPR) repeat protein